MNNVKLMKRLEFSLPIAVFLLIVVLLGSLGLRGYFYKTSSPIEEIALLVPDDIDTKNPLFQVWIDAFEEEGYPLAVLKASEFVRLSLDNKLKLRGIVWPDNIHRNAGHPLVQEVHKVVAAGTNLMLVFDAGIAANSGVINRPNRLKDLAGTDYALYDELGENVVRNGRALVPKEAFKSMAFTPGRFSQLGSEGFGANDNLATTYLYDVAQFPYFVTTQQTSGKLLSYSGQSTIASLNQYRNGKVLFVNTPLGYLKHRTDGQWLHTYLRFFANEILLAPQLLTTQNGIGGLIINWHVDNKFALDYIDLLDQVGFDKQGPFSVHFTVGPDTDEPGDGRGMDLSSNPAMQSWIKTLMARGHEIGSHGGWIHNYFAAKIDENSRAVDSGYIKDNIDAIKKVTGKPMKEYSAPSGNHPAWVTQYIEEQGIKAYYYTGNAGMGPTRSYIDTKKGPTRSWSFPVSHVGQVASFEEAARSRYSNEKIFTWLRDLTLYTQEQRSLRLFYFHPIGVKYFKSATAQWLLFTEQAKAGGNFKFYTMADQAQFLDRRQYTKWRYEAGADGGVSFSATNDKGLTDLAWRLPKSRFNNPVIKSGPAGASVIGDQTDWILRVGSEMATSITFNATLKQ